MYNTLTNHNLFNVLTEESRQKLSRIAKIKRYRKGELLIKENESNENLFLLTEGSVRIESADGERIAVLRSGSVIGEISTAGMSLPIANVIAEDAVKAAVFPLHVISDIVSREPIFDDALRELGMQRVTSRLFGS